MIVANKKPLVLSIFRLYVKKWLFQRSFSSVSIRMDEAYDQKQPLLLMANHSSWWDGMVALLLANEVVQHNEFVMMSEKGIKQYPFFTYLGAYSINASKPKDIFQSLHYTKTLLKAGQAVWLFPQGEEEALEKRPLQFQSGIGWLCERAETAFQIAPVTFSYHFAAEKKPRLYVHLGKSKSSLSITGAMKEKTKTLERLLTTQLDEQRRAIIERQFSGYHTLLRGYGDRSAMQKEREQ